MSRSLSTIYVARLKSCANDSADQGSCRVRLPASIWAAAGIAYHKPVIVSISSNDSSPPWRLLCVSALLSEEDIILTQPLHDLPSALPQLLSPQLPQPLTPPGFPKQKPKQQSSLDPRRDSIPAAFGVLDPTVLLPPPGCTLEQFHQLLTRPMGTSAEVAACRVTSVAAAVEAQVRVLPGQEHMVTPRMSFKLHQALVLPGCWLRLSRTCHVEVVSVQPEPPLTDQPLRIVPSTRLVFAGYIGEPCSPLPPQPQQQPQQQRQGNVLDPDLGLEQRPAHGSLDATAVSGSGNSASMSASTSASKGRASRQPKSVRQKEPTCSLQDLSFPCDSSPLPDRHSQDPQLRLIPTVAEPGAPATSTWAPGITADAAADATGSELTEDGSIQVVDSRDTSVPPAARKSKGKTMSKPRSGSGGSASSQDAKKSSSKSKGTKSGGIMATASAFNALLGLSEED